MAAIWGIEVKPGKPCTQRFDKESGRLHVTQATLGTYSSKRAAKKVIVQCNVGNEKPVSLCSLLPEKIENCRLCLELEAKGEVTFSVIGPHSVLLSGYIDYSHVESQYDSEDDYENYSYKEDAKLENEGEGSTDSNTEDNSDEFGDHDTDMFTSSPVRNSGVRTEEILDDDKPLVEYVASQQPKKKKNKLSGWSEDNDNEDGLPISAPGGFSIIENEDEDGLPISTPDNRITNVPNTEEETYEVKDKSIDEGSKKSQKKEENGSIESIKRKLRSILGDGDKSREKKKSKKQDNGDDSNVEKIISDETGSSMEIKKKAEARALQTKSFRNGLVMEELELGPPDGKKATPGKKASVHYIGKLKKNGKKFDSNIGKPPFKFRLGAGRVVKAWDIGISGMRVGDKRRLTIPPTMRHRKLRDATATVSPKAWLIYDVELVDVC